MANTRAMTMCVLCLLCLQCLMVYSVSGYVLQRQHDGTMSNTANDMQNVKVSARSASSDEKTSVHHFAIHNLCRHYKGQQYFYQALKSKLCEMRGMFVANLVMTMCEQRTDDLYNWVAELFDIDGDGHISYFEKHFYKFDD